MFFFCHVILNDEEKNKRRFTNRTSSIYYTTLFLNQPAFFLSLYDRGERLLDQTKRAIIYSRENIMYRHLLFMIYLFFLLKQNDLVIFSKGQKYILDQIYGEFEALELRKTRS